MKSLIPTALIAAFLAPLPAVVAVAADERVEVTVGRSQLLATAVPLERVAVSDPKVAGVKVISNRQIMVQGLSPGVTTLIVWTKDGGTRSYDVRVAREAHSGQVAIDVHVLELAKSAGLNLGVTVGGGETTTVENGVRKYVFKPGDFMIGEQTPGGFPNNIGGLDFLAARIAALQSRGEAKLLARPTLVTVDGGTAKFLAGGEIPIPIPQALGVTTIAWKEFGVRLEIQPTINPNGSITLVVKPEVSSLDYANGLKLATITIPSIKTRRIETVVSLYPRETLMLGGLMSAEQNRSWDGLPGLADIPIIGELFRSRRFSDNETELAILVTPRMVSRSDPTTLPGRLPEVQRDLERGR